MEPWLIEAAGWVAAGFTLAAYSMKTMLPLRVTALFSNIFFIIYGFLVPIYPALALHAVLLPFNAFRLYELLQLEKKAKQTRVTDNPLAWIGHVVAPVQFRTGDTIFEKGDRPDHVYYLEKGSVTLEEIGVTLSEGEIFGEIAFFTDAQERTQTARAVTECRIMVLDERDFMRIYYQQPAFALYIVKLIATRLSASP